MIDLANVKRDLRHWIDRSGGLDACSDFWWAKTNGCTEEDIRRLKSEIRREADDLATLRNRPEESGE